MKTNIIFFTLALFVTNTLLAQIGLKGGLSLNKPATYWKYEQHRGKQIETTSPDWGYQFGVVARVIDMPFFDLNAELLFENRRGSRTYDFAFFPDPDDREYEVEQVRAYRNSYNYVSLPILGAIGGDEGIQVYLGPTISYLISARSELTVSTTSDAPEGAFSGRSNSPEMTMGTTTERIDLVNEGRHSKVNRLNISGNLGVLVPLGYATTLDVRLFHTLTDLTNSDAERSIIQEVRGEPASRHRNDSDHHLGAQVSFVYLF